MAILYSDAKRPAIKLPFERTPIHPGTILAKYYMQYFRLSIDDLVEMTGLLKEDLSQVTGGLKPVTIDMAARFSRLFDTTIEFWLQGQMAWDIWQVMRLKKTGSYEYIKPLKLGFKGKGTEGLWVPFEQLTEDERVRLMQFNRTLFVIEKKIKKEALRLIRQCKKRLSQPREAFLKDFEAQVLISFIMDESDPYYRDDDDNIMAELQEHVLASDFKYGLADGNNHNDTPRLEGGEGDDKTYHCWLFHSLYDHARPRLRFRDMLRIGSIWIDLVVWYQDFVGIDQNMDISDYKNYWRE